MHTYIHHLKKLPTFVRQILGAIAGAFIALAMYSAGAFAFDTVRAYLPSQPVVQESAVKKEDAFKQIGELARKRMEQLQ